jgi:hypothetical protein
MSASQPPVGNNVFDRRKLFLVGLAGGCILCFGPMALFGTPNTVACFALSLLNIPFVTTMVMWVGSRAVRIDSSGTVGTSSRKGSDRSHELTNGRTVVGCTSAAHRGSLVGSSSVH